MGRRVSGAGDGGKWDLPRHPWGIAKPTHGYLFKTDDSNELDMSNPIPLEGVEKRLNPLDL